MIDSQSNENKGRLKNEHDKELLQSDIDRLEEWCDANELELNSTKCSTITFNRKRKIGIRQYQIGGRNIDMVQVIKDLGVDINSSMRILDGSVESSEFLASLNFNTNMLKARSAPLFKSVSQHKTDYGRNNPLERLIREFKQIQHEFDFHLTKNNFKTNLVKNRN
ncbi:CLUMA_CG004038, isoform A [Clunio marinus]|uniref:CLUMA_CG004038, isoform A n=1 Tax=Clunio marinus TaxID=568069 RepID=A0A1J1HQH9_9DIPT|nr:CLUMA_CG004038, isoform A [Clunio marinus]